MSLLRKFNSIQLRGCFIYNAMIKRTFHKLQKRCNLAPCHHSCVECLQQLLRCFGSSTGMVSPRSTLSRPSMEWSFSRSLSCICKKSHQLVVNYNFVTWGKRNVTFWFTRYANRSVHTCRFPVSSTQQYYINEWYICGTAEKDIIIKTTCHIPDICFMICTLAIQ